MALLTQRDDEATVGREGDSYSTGAPGTSFLLSEHPYTSARNPFGNQATPHDSQPMSPLEQLDPAHDHQTDLTGDAIIGTIRLSGKVVCQHLGCSQSFGRPAELKRHHATSHAINKPDYWCRRPICDRSRVGGRPFHRKDKMSEHERKVHHRGIHRKGR